MRYACLLLIFWIIVMLPAYGQKKAKVDTVAAFRAFNEGERLRKAAKYDSAITNYQQSANGYKAFALSLPNKKKWIVYKKRAWEQHFRAQGMVGWCLNSKGQSDSALKVLLEAKEKCSQVLGDTNLAMATITNIMGSVYIYQGQYEQALRYYQRSLTINKVYLGENNPLVATCYNNIGNVYWYQGQYAQALEYYQLSLPIFKQTMNKNELMVASINENIGIVYLAQSQYDQALEHYHQSLAIRKQELGENHPDVANSYYHIGMVYNYQGHYAQAMEFYQKSLTIRKQALGEQHPLVAMSYKYIGIVYSEQGQYDQALLCHQRSLGINKRALGENHPDVANGYISIGILYSDQGQYAQALDYFNRSLAIFKQALGEQHPFVATSYMGIGNAFHAQGQYAQAQEYYQRSLAIRKQVLGEQHPDVAGNFMNIGAVFVSQSQFAQALENLQRSLAIRKQVLGEEHPDVAITYSNIGNAYTSQGQYAQGLDYFQRCLAIRKQVLGEEHPDVAITYSNIGGVYYKQGQYIQALEYHQRGLAIYKLALGEQHPDLAKSYYDIGAVYSDQGQDTQAMEYFQQSLYSYLPNFQSKHYASLLANSPKVLENSLTQIPKVLKHRNAPGDDTLALATVRFADRYIDSLRRAYTYENDKLELGGNANQLYQVAIDVARWNKQEDECFYYSEKNKAAVLSQSLNEATALKLGGIPDSLLEKDKELRTLLAFYTKAGIDEELNCPKCDSTKLQNFRNSLFTHQQQQTALKARLESEFPQYFTLKYKDAKISVKEIQQGFLSENPKSALIEYLLGDTVLYAFCITKDKYAIHRQKLDSTKYKKTNALQLEVKKLGRALADAKLYLDPTTVVSQPAGALYDYLIKPFEAQIKGKDLVIIPDAELNKIPFELLIKPNPNLKAMSKWQELPYLIKQHNISYHYSAHLLLEDWQKHKSQPVQSSGFLAFAPVFDDTSTGKIVSNENVIEKSYLTYVSREDTVSRAFTNDGKFISPLPGTEREVKTIYELFNQQNQPAKYYLNDQANEATVKSIDLKPYKYLHFATHGLTDEDRPTQSCLILAQKPDSTADNLLTSSEMYGLELDADLVVLSACQTGKGTLKAGEGIIGLTRGLLYAGARNLLVSQWNVNDASTAELMTKFYSKILAGQSNRQALREAKLELLNSKFACPHYWSAFVLVGR